MIGGLAWAQGTTGSVTMRRKRGRRVHALGRLHVVARLGVVNAGHELLRVAVDQREPRRLHLHHDAVTLLEHVVVFAQRHRPLARRVRHERVGRLEALVEPPATDLHRDRQFVSIERPCVRARRRPGLGVPRVRLRVFGVDVDQLDYEVCVGPRGRREQRRRQRAGNGDVMIQRRADVREHVGAPLDESLVGHFPAPPVPVGIRGRDRPLPVRHRVRGIGHVLAIRHRGR